MLSGEGATTPQLAAAHKLLSFAHLSVSQGASGATEALVWSNVARARSTTRGVPDYPGLAHTSGQHTEEAQRAWRHAQAIGDGWLAAACEALLVEWGALAPSLTGADSDWHATHEEGSAAALGAGTVPLLAGTQDPSAAHDTAWMGVTSPADVPAPTPGPGQAAAVHTMAERSSSNARPLDRAALQTGRKKLQAAPSKALRV